MLRVKLNKVVKFLVPSLGWLGTFLYGEGREEKKPIVLIF